MSFTKLASVDELPSPGQAKEFSCAGKLICVANVDGSLTAMDNICLHRGGPLGQGEVEDGKIVCPWHGWRWDPATGAVAHDSHTRLPVYPLKLDGNDVLIEV